MLVNFLIFFSFQMIMPSLPLHIREMGASEDIIGLIAGVFTVTSLGARPFIGRYLDTKGRKNIYLFGLLIIIISIVAYKFVPIISLFIFVRLLHGLGWSASTTSASTIATDIIPKPRLGEGMGYFGLTAVLAMALAPAIGLEIFHRVNFALLCDISVILAIIGIILAVKLPSSQIEQTTGPNHNISLFEKQAYLPAVIIFFTTLTYGSVVTFIAIYALDFDIQNIGVFFTVYSAALFISRPFFGKLIDKRGYRIVLIPGLLCIIATLPLLVFAQNLLSFIIAAVIYGIGFGAVQPTLQTMAVANVPPQRRGAANSTFMCGFDLGMGSGAVIWGFIAKTFGLQVMYALNMIPAIFALLLYLGLQKKIAPDTKV